MRQLRVAVLVIVFVSARTHADMEFYGNTLLGIAYTDNVELQESNEQTDTVYFFSPIFGLALENSRITASLEYTPEVIHRDSSGTEAFHLFDGALDAEVIRDFFNIELGATRVVSIVDAEQGRLPTDFLIDDLGQNRAESTYYTVKPIIERKFTNGIDLLASHEMFENHVDQSNLFDSDGSVSEFDLNNFAQQTVLTWKLEYSGRRVEYEDSPEFKFEEARGELGARVTDGLRVFVGYGEETDFDQAIVDPDETTSFQDIGFEWAPNDRIFWSGVVADRSFGNSISTDFSYMLKRGQFGFRYDEEVTSRTLRFLSRNPDRNSGGIDALLDEAGSRDQFVSELGEIYLRLEGISNTIDVRIFKELIRKRSDLDGTTLDNQEERGVRFDWESILNERVSTELNLEVAEIERGDAGDSGRVYSIGGAVNYRWTPRTVVAVSYYFDKLAEDSLLLESYTRNMIRLTLKYEL